MHSDKMMPDQQDLIPRTWPQTECEIGSLKSKDYITKKGIFSESVVIFFILMTSHLSGHLAKS